MIDDFLKDSFLLKKYACTATARYANLFVMSGFLSRRLDIETGFRFDSRPRSLTDFKTLKKCSSSFADLPGVLGLLRAL